MKNNRLFRLFNFAIYCASALTLASCSMGGTDTGFAKLSAAQALGPTVTITSPPEGSFITTSNFTAFTLTGFCTYDGGVVTVATAVPVFASTICAGNSWTVTLDVSFIFDGVLPFDVNHTGPAGEPVPTFTRNYVKDTLPPTGNSVMIGDGITPPMGPAVILNLTSTGATQMYITNTAGCATGGTLTPYATTANWNIQPVGNTATVYAQFSDDAGNKSPCVSASITTAFAPPPTVTIATPAPGTIISASMASAVHLGGSCSEEGRPVAVAGSVTSTTTCTNLAWDVVLDLSALADGPTAFTATHSSQFGQTASAFASFMKDTTAPNGTIIINGGAPSTHSVSVALTLNAIGASEMYITNSPGCTSGGIFEPYATTKPWTLGQTNATATVYVAYRDPAGNVGACVSAQIVHSNIPLTITPAAISLSANSAQSTTFTAAGGVPGYTFSVRSGDGTIIPSTGVYSVAAGATGTTIIRLTDAVGGTTDAVVSHIQQTAIAQLVFDGPVRAIGFDSDGNHYYGGNFSRVAGTMTPGIVGLDSQGNPSNTFNPAVGFNGPVNAVVYLGDGSIIAGGSFSTYRGAPARAIAHLSAAGLLDPTFSPSTGPNGFDGAVKALALDPTTGAIFAGGEFKKYRNSPSAGIAKLDLAGRPDAVFNPSSGRNSSCVDATVNAIVITGNSVIIGGNFKTYRGASARSIAKINALTGAMDTTFSPAIGLNGFNGTVRALAMSDSRIYVGGDFKEYRNAAVNGIVRLSLNGAIDSGFNTGSVRAGNIKEGKDRDDEEDTDDEKDSTRIAVNAIDVTENAVYFGGKFTTYRGTAVNNLAKVNLDGSLTDGFLTTGEKGTRGAITGLKVGHDNLYIVGPFTYYRAKMVNGIAKVNALSGAIDPVFNASGLGFSREGSVPSLAMVTLSNDGSQIIVGGDIVGALYQGTVTGRLAKVNVSGDLDLTFVSSAKVDAEVDSIAISDRTIYIGGQFRTVSGKIANHLAKLNQAGQLDTAFSPQAGANGLDGPAYALAVYQNTLYAGGEFQTYRGVRSTRLARLSSAGILEPLFDCRTGLNGTVRALTLAQNGSVLYAGGDFTGFKGLRANHIAKIATATSALDLTFNPQPAGHSEANGFDEPVLALALDPSGTKIYVGGNFSTYRGNAAEKITRLNGDGTLDGAFFVTPSGAGGCPFASVSTIAVDSTGNHIFFGGRTFDVSGTTVNHIAMVSNTGQVDTLFSPSASPSGVNLLPGVEYPVQAIAIDGSRVHIGGTFTSYRQLPVQNLAIVDFSGALSQ